jgi:DMSO reductase anchor subunit
VPNYLAHALSTGAVLLHLAAQAWGEPQPAVGAAAILAVLLAALVKRRYWRFIDTSKSVSTPETATGLGARGKVRLLDPPHATENYLQKEMGFAIARKHAEKLRTIVRWFAYGFPAGLSVPALLFAGNALGIALAFLAAIFALAGTLVERWLFFAEAKHAVTLYYGSDEI